MMMILVTLIHVIVCLFLILVVLLQQGKSADWSGTFGGGSSQTAFGQRGSATLLSKATTAAAIIFMQIFFNIEQRTQVPGDRHLRFGGQPRMEGPAEWKGIYDSHRRLMVIANYNQDTGDA